MATYDLTNDSTTYPMVGYSPSTQAIRNPMHGVFNLTSRVLQLKNYVTTNDTVQFMDLPIGATVLGGYLTVLEAPNEAIDMEVGTGADPNGYLVSVNIPTTVTVGKQFVFDGALLGVANVSADTADIVLANVGAALTSGKFVVTVIFAGNAGVTTTINA